MIENSNVICNDCGFGKQNKELKDKCERLEKQFEIAVNGLERVNNISNNQEKGIQSLVNQIVSCWLASHSALKQIRELEK